MDKEYCLGVPVTILSYKEIIDGIESRMQLGLKSSIVAVNPEKIIMTQKDEILTAFMTDVTYPIPDGIGVIFASRMNKGTIASRVTGIKMMEALLEYANEKRSKIFLYGAKEEVLGEVVNVVKSRFPYISIAGYVDGYVDNEEQVIKKMNESGADFLFLALGSPRQELWIHQHFSLLQVKVVQGVGGSFDVFAGAVKRAPVILQRCGMEWMYRLIREPKRLKRQLVIPKYFFQIAANMVRAISGNEGNKDFNKR